MFVKIKISHFIKTFPPLLHFPPFFPKRPGSQSHSQISSFLFPTQNPNQRCSARKNHLPFFWGGGWGWGWGLETYGAFISFTGVFIHFSLCPASPPPPFRLLISNPFFQFPQPPKISLQIPRPQNLSLSKPFLLPPNPQPPTQFPLSNSSHHARSYNPPPVSIPSSLTASQTPKPTPAYAWSQKPNNAPTTHKPHNAPPTQQPKNERGGQRR